MRIRKRVLSVGVLALGTAIALSGCSGGGSSAKSTSSGSATGTVTISGAFTGAQGTAFQNDLNAWSKGTGITVQYSGSSSFQTSIVTQVKGGNTPDIAIFPAPGVLQSLISQGMIPLDDLVNVKSIESDEPSAKGIVSTQYQGKTYGLPYNINIKSLVWYDPAAFKKAGLTVPTTDAQLQSVSKTIISKNLGYPWCAGIAATGANGWPMTDWLEQYVLDYGGETTYNNWISHKVLFNSPVVKEAANKVASMLFQPGEVNGGQKAIASSNFQTVGNNLFVSGKAKGQCFMMKQGSFITGFFPTSIQNQITKGDLTNVNAFVLPSPKGGNPPVEGGGDLVAAFHNTPAVKKVVAYLVGKDFGSHGYAKQWNASLNPHTSFDASLYGTPFQKLYAGILKNSSVFVFDASDQMPGAVGSGTEWTNLTQWTAGQQSLQSALS